MAYEEHYNNFVKCRNLGHFEDAEKHISDALKEVFTLKDQSLSAQCLWDLGNLYTVYGNQKKDGDSFTKAVALYNAALRRLDMVPDCQNTQNKLWNAIKETEKIFSATVLGDCKHGCINEKDTDILHRQMLSDIRIQITERLLQIDEESDCCIPQLNDVVDSDEERVKAEKTRFELIRSLSCFVSNEIKQFLKRLISECIEYLGEPPCKYAFLGLGSLAKNEMTPYSDLEFAILVDENAPRTIQYFRNLTDTLHIKILNLGETVLPSMYIKSLNDFESSDPNDNWFYDHVTPKGLSFDGAMPWACKTPKGRKPTESKPWQTELIQTPAGLASFQIHDSILKEGYKMADVLISVCLVEGCEILLSDYLQGVDEILSRKSSQSKKTPYSGQNTSRKVRALTSLREDYEKYNINSDIFTEGALHDVKNQLYRFSSTVVQCLRMYFNVRSPQTFDIVCRLFDTGIISDENKHELLMVSAMSYEMRVRTYTKLRRQKETASVIPPLCFDAENNYDVFFAENDEVIFRFYQTAIPLSAQLRRILAGKLEFNNGLKTVKLFDGSWHTKGIIYHRLIKLEKARECLEKAIDQDPAKIDSYIWLARILHSQTCHEESLVYSRKALDLVQHVNANLENREVLYHTMGLTLAMMGSEKHDEALVCLHKAIQINSEIFGFDWDVVNVPTLITIGYVYSKKKDFDIAREFQLRALKAEKEKEGDISCSVFASIIYNNMGVDAYNSGQYDEAAMYHETSLAIRKRIFGNVCHPLIAVNVDGLGRTYTFLGQYRKALPFLKEYKRMKDIDIAQSKRDTTGLCNAGVVMMKQSFDNNGAVQMFEEALKINKESNADDPLQAVIFNNIGYASNNLGLFDRAERYYEKALKEIENLSPDMDHGVMYDYKARFSHNLGALLFTLGKFSQSLARFQLALQIRTELNAVKIVSVTESFIALLLYKMEKLPTNECIDMCENAKANHWSAHGDLLSWDHVIIINNLGQLYACVGRYTRAIECHQEAISVCQDIYDTELHGDLAQSYYLLGRSWQDAGNLEKAICYLKKALSILRKIHGETSRHADIMKTLKALRKITRSSVTE